MRVYQYKSYTLSIYSKDHDPIHCHVSVGDICEVRVYLPSLEMDLKWGKEPPQWVKDEIKKLVYQHRKIIGRQWRTFHDQ